MSVKLVRNAIAELREATAAAAWAQWGAVFSLSRSERAARAIVDPEALLLISLYLRDHEPRLWSAPRVWAQIGPRLLSVQRAKNLLPLFPPSVRARLSEFARLAVDDGGDIRWRSVLSEGVKRPRGNGRHKDAAVRVEGAPAIILRLRLGLGVGIKADLIAHLIGQAGAAPTVQRSARKTFYHPRAVRRALEELAGAGLIDMRPSAPLSYRLDLQKWAGLMAFDPNEPPPWRSWATAYGFVAALDQWSHSLGSESRYVLASEARDLVNAHARELDPVIRVPPLDKYRGEVYLEPFVEAITACGEFMRQAV